MSGDHPQCIWAPWKRCRVPITLQSGSSAASKRVNFLPRHGCELDVWEIERWLHVRHQKRCIWTRRARETKHSAVCTRPVCLQSKHSVNKSRRLWAAWHFYELEFNEYTKVISIYTNLIGFDLEFSKNVHCTQHLRHLVSKQTAVKSNLEGIIAPP